MDFSNRITGEPIQQLPMFVPGGGRRTVGYDQGVPTLPATAIDAPQQQHRHARSRTADGRKPRRDRERVNRPSAAGSQQRSSVEQFVDNTITNPAFWSTVFSTLQNNATVAEDIRRDLEQQEIRVGKEREAAAHGSAGGREDGTSGDAMDTDGSGGGDEGLSNRHRSVLPDLYDAMSHGLANVNRTVGGVQRLDLLVEELDIDALWSARDVTISFGAMTRIMLRLFAGPYASEEENLIVRMMNLGVERACKAYGFQDSVDSVAGGRAAPEPFALTYKRRSRVLRDFAAFRYMLEVTEQMGRIGRKHKNDLLLLYLTLTTPEVRLHRKMNSGDRDNVLAFRDCVTGFTIATPPVMAKPMSVEMHLDSVFGNVSNNSRLLERSLAAALNGRHRRVGTGGPNAAREVEALLENARLLDVGSEPPRTVSRPYTLSARNENLALRHMLEMSVVVSMMAEEFRVFIAGAPASRCDDGVGQEAGGAKEGGAMRSCKNKNSQRRRPYAHRRPIFLAFKPVSQAVSNS